MKKENKIKIIKWYIKSHCQLGEIQTKKDNTDDLNILEELTMNDRAYPKHSSCCSCWYRDRDYQKKCISCDDGSNYTFPYGYWNKFYERDGLR